MISSKFYDQWFRILFCRTNDVFKSRQDLPSFHGDPRIDSLWPVDAIWSHRTWSILVQLIVSCLAAPSHYLNQYWLIISEVLWHSHGGNFSGNIKDMGQVTKVRLSNQVTSQLHLHYLTHMYTLGMSLKFTNFKITTASPRRQVQWSKVYSEFSLSQTLQSVGVCRPHMHPSCPMPPEPATSMHHPRKERVAPRQCLQSPMSDGPVMINILITMTHMITNQSTVCSTACPGLQQRLHQLKLHITGPLWEKTPVFGAFFS